MENHATPTAFKPVARKSSITYDETTLRQRKTASKETAKPEVTEAQASENLKGDITWGKTPSGVVFRAPPTHSFLHTLLTTFTRSSLTRLTVVSLVFQPVVFYLLAHHTTLRSVFFLFYFAFWRGAYDFGFAWVLRQQSEKKWIDKSLKRWGWLDVNSESGGEEGREWARWWKRELEMKMGEGYKWEGVPDEFNSWLIFRQLVDVVLLNDFVSYTCFAWSHLNFPANHSIPMHIFRWVLGWSLIAFNLWVKIDAHRVVKDYAWYWGDAFWLMVMQDDLVFDGVYEIAPHPMYSVGYAGYYGLSMVVGSYTVFFVSLAAHAAQFAFLLWFENPHIERIYGGGRKPLASRVPLPREEAPQASAVDESFGDSGFTTILEGHELHTPAATEGKSRQPLERRPAYRSSGDTETEPELPELPSNISSDPVIVSRSRSESSFSSTAYAGRGPRRNMKRSRSISMHDLNNRATDFALVLLVAYSLSTLVPALSNRLSLIGHFLHALAWRLFHSFGLGLLLEAQSKSKWLVRHYLKHYHYSGESVTTSEEDERESVVKRATEEAFGNWQVTRLDGADDQSPSRDWLGRRITCQWTGPLAGPSSDTSLDCYEVLGDFGWLYSDFFLLEQIPSQLAYTGIYRFLNNPERSMGGAAFLGLSLISNSSLVLIVAVISHLSHWWFLSHIEQPHMERLYGARLRKDGGLTKTLKSVAEKTLASKAGKHGHDLQRVVQEVRGSLEKVEGKVTEVVGEFLEHGEYTLGRAVADDSARPMFSEVVDDTKFLLQRSRERLIITRIATDIAAYDSSRYSMALPSGSSAPPQFHVGQPIRVSWTAPHNHSRKDWIGIYRLGSCKSQLVTRISSVGKWMPLYEEEWDGNTPLNPEDKTVTGDAGEVVFKGDQLPWSPGQYELRYHHDGKHNVLSRIAPFDIFVAKPANPDNYQSIHETLLNIVCLSLDSDPVHIPKIARPVESRAKEPNVVEDNAIDDEEAIDPDDFTLMDEKQAKRIVAMAEIAFGVDLSTDVVIADANVATLARRVVGARSLVMASGGRNVG
ncbi:phosphatidylethanolamine N-methyltransferase, partial [Tremellales sp. Uapishka_1]